MDILEKKIGNQLQYSFLENIMDRGAWQATVHGVARVGYELVTKPPIRSDSEHLFLVLLAICISSLENVYLGLLPTFWLGCSFFWYWATWLYIMEINSLTLASFAIIFSHSEGCLITLLIVSFTVQRFFKFNYVPFIYFCFYFHYSGRWVLEDFSVIYVEVCSAYVFL